jgi:subtilisin family serine protease
MKLFHALLFALLLLLLPLFTAGSHSSSDSSKISHQLAQTSIHIHAASFATAADGDFNEAHLRDASVAASAAVSVSSEEEQELSDRLFHKAVFTQHGSHTSPSSPSLSSRLLGAQKGDKQFFVRFSTRCDIGTLLALQRFTGRRIIALVDHGLYVVIGDDNFAAKARRFPGVAWVQQREGESKLGRQLQELVKESTTRAQPRSDPVYRSSGDVFTEIVAECWYEECADVAALIRHLCSDVYLHPTLVEVHCPSHALGAATALLSQHIGVDHVDVKAVATVANFGGRSIIGSGTTASSPEASLVLSRINLSASIIAVADTGIDMNSCFFYDNITSAPWNNSRVVQSYNVLPCEVCGRCCGQQSGPACTNASNACGNFIDEQSHGTHVAGTVAGVGPNNVAYGNGIAGGSKIFFQDMENLQNNTQCYAPDMCLALARPTDMLNLLQPAYNAGARVHVNSWGTQENPQYNLVAKGTDEFVYAHPTFIVLFSAGNSGADAALGTVYGSATCKNCLSVGGTQQTDSLFRSMEPYVDDGEFCNMLKLKIGVCEMPLQLVNRCCTSMNLLNMSLPCCAKQTSCVDSGECSIQSGNLRSATNVASFSSRGPSLDGRFKPDLVAPGEHILSAATPEQRIPGKFRSTSPNHCVVPNNTRARTEQENFDRALKIESGTSMSAPLTAGAVEKIRQYFVQGYYPAGKLGTGLRFEPAEALVRAVVLASCRSSLYDPSWAVWSQPFPPPAFPNFFRYRIPPSSSPNFYHGFGLPVLDQAVYMADSNSSHRMFYTNGTYTPRSSATAYTIMCDPSQSVPLTVVLVWTDPPSGLSSQRQIVNDLDLIVVLPGATPSQIFGNMRADADQLNTVERVITQCPVSGNVTAVVALGDLLKSSSQKWFLVANGPIKSDIVSAVVPSYSTGRSPAPSTQSEPCYSDAAIFTTVKFNPSSSWACVGSEWGCSVKERGVATTLAQILGVATQAIRVTFNPSEPASISMILQCSAMINSWQNETAGLKYVNSTALLSGMRSVSVSMYGNDPVLAAFDWATLTVAAAPPEVSIIVSHFSDSGCRNLTEKPFFFNSRYCSFGFVIPNVGQVYLKAISCDAKKASYQLSLNPDTCTAIAIENQEVANCTATPTNTIWTMYTCTPSPAPPVSPTPSPAPPVSPTPSPAPPVSPTPSPAPPVSPTPLPAPPVSPALSPESSSSASSLAVIVGCSVGGFVVGTYITQLLDRVRPVIDTLASTFFIR